MAGRRSPAPSGVSGVQRRRNNSFRSNDNVNGGGDNGGENDDALAMASARRQMRDVSGSDHVVVVSPPVTTATDEFGFPISTASGAASPFLRQNSAPQQRQSAPSSSSGGRGGRGVHHGVVSATQSSDSLAGRPAANPDGRGRRHRGANGEGGTPPVVRTASSSSSSNRKQPQQTFSRQKSDNDRTTRRSRRATGNDNGTIVTTTNSQSNNNKSNNPRRRPPSIKVTRPPPDKYATHTFQHPANAMRCTVRTVDLSTRVAFDSPLPEAVSYANLSRMLEEMERVRGGGRIGGASDGDSAFTNATTSGSNAGVGRKGKRSDNPCRISPSPNHARLLEFMFGGGGGVGKNKRRIVRQLQWNPACSVDADPWFDGTYDEEGDAGGKDNCHIASIKEGVEGISLNDNAPNNTNQQSSSAKKMDGGGKNNRRRRRKPKSVHGDGRYIPINPVTATRSSLPSHSPLLTNVKRRLPTRPDVGFANPDPEDVRRKMEEVRREAEWEEACPRLVLMFSAFDLFRGGETADCGAAEDAGQDGVDRLHPSCRDDVELWSGGSVPGIPFAGRDLVDARKTMKRLEQQANAAEDDGELQTETFRTHVSDIERITNPRSYSVFAPPVDATFSSSQLWRPRPFMDRPPGHMYFLACPLDVRFDIGDLEPYFCTMALYNLPSGVGHDFRGKISEDFFFPAGDWKGIEGNGESFDDVDDERPQSWRRRRRRAIMSYDPLEVSVEDLYLVIQIFRAIRPDGEKQGSSSDQPNKGIGSKIKRSLRGRSKEKNNATTDNSQSMAFSASFDETGAQHLAPFCFGIARAFSGSDAKEKRESARCYSFPDVPESQDDFVKKLLAIAHPKTTTGDDAKTRTAPIGCRVDLLTSHLGSDFTRALLDETLQLYNTLMGDDVPLGPQLLADVMGDSAISLDGLGSIDAKNQRSNLRRLPPSHDSGYSSSFDLKEVLYLPPRSSPRKYEVDSALCASTALNLLYIYPRLIRMNKSGHSQTPFGHDRLSLRLQVVEQELPPNQSFDNSTNPTYEALQAIYNPSSPAGPPLVHSYFTKLVGNGDSKTKSGRQDIPLKDEVKLRLPDILDRRHFLQASLFCITSNGGIDLIAETTIPFIISSKESISKSRVTTIIPNGLHRVQLNEEFQIHFETRLASSTHVSDSSIATLLRDYPTSNSNSVDCGDVEPTTNVIVHPSGIPFLDILSMASGQAVKRHSSSLLTANMLNLANESCPPFYFETLYDMSGSDAGINRLVAWEKTDSLFAIIRSICDILDKTHSSFQERDQSMFSLQYQRLLKSTLDSFDEMLFSNHYSDTFQHLETGDSMNENQISDSIDSQSYNDGSLYTDTSLEMAESTGDQQTRKPKYKILSPRNNASFDQRSFSRRAFIATRKDQLNAEAEPNDDEIYRREYFDDDETIVTLGTMTSTRLDSGSVFPIILETKSYGHDHEILRTDSSTMNHGEADIQAVDPKPRKKKASPTRSPVQPVSKASYAPFSFASKRAEYMASRVNTFAQVVMAPCIAPSVDESPHCSNSIVDSSSDAQVAALNTVDFSGGNRSPFETSSDAEEEGEAKDRSVPYLRGNQSCLKILPIVFQPMRASGDHISMSKNYSPDNDNDKAYLYEKVITLWVQSWTSLAASIKSEVQIDGSGKTISSWPYKLLALTQSDAIVGFAFIRHMQFFLPLCLKSIGLRCARLDTTKLIVPMNFLDDNHMQMLVPLVETIALGLMREAMSGSNGTSNADQQLTKALIYSDCALDFIIGLFSLLHPSQPLTALVSYITMLEGIEVVSAAQNGESRLSAMNKSHLRCCKCSRQIRLHAVERLAGMPAFTKLNFPIKFTGKLPPKSSSEHELEIDSLREYWEKVDRFPKSFWLSELMMNQCLSICNRSCATIIAEASKHTKAAKFGQKMDNGLSRDDLLRLESLAFHSILNAYELLIKRQSMDSRFQSISSGTRVAAMFTRPVLRQSIDAVSMLVQMDRNQEVRIVWLLCLLYVLQESPDALIRGELRRLSDPKENRINELVRLLKLASTTCQHFIPGDESLPVFCQKEMAQESFNTISASVILLIDECFDVVSRDKDELERLGKSVFDLLLHLLSAPQSSVTLLRTLGGSAHALDKFGSVIFLKTVGNQLQHWARVILTAMNSTELSVRSMAVDLLVSLLGYIQQEHGNIDSISLCILSVLPEVVAREVGLCHASGLIKSMEAAEPCLWPLRRALADVEETSPEDDDRINDQILPALTTLCRTGQAIVDGVLIELRLTGSADFDLSDIMTNRRSWHASRFDACPRLSPKAIFDADEESILEVATFFSHESSLTQKLRWLFTLRDLHVAKRQWAEVSETLMLCARTLVQSFGHLQQLWQPNRFNLWNDSRHAPWLSSVGLPDRQGNAEVMEFANSFIECDVFIRQQSTVVPMNYISVANVCSTLMQVIDQMEKSYDEEGGMEDLALWHFEELLSMISAAINDDRKRQRTEGSTALRHVRANICSKLAIFSKRGVIDEDIKDQTHIRLLLHGNKPERFKESTSLPTFLEWDVPSIFRVPKHALVEASGMSHLPWEERVVQSFTRPLIDALVRDDAGDVGDNNIVLRFGGTNGDSIPDETKTYISAMVVQQKSPGRSRKFFVRHQDASVTEYTVAHTFPHALSRQRTLITSEIKVAPRNMLSDLIQV